MKTSTTTRGPIYKEITPEEMMRLRVEEGLSNAEIAERCEVSPVTVRKYIGNQNFRKATRTSQEPDKCDLKPKPAPKPLLHVSEQTLIGAVATYVLFPKQGTITVKAQTDASIVEAQLSFKEAIQIVEELQEALMKMTEMEA